jgi:hypothetical protein
MTELKSVVVTTLLLFIFCSLIPLVAVAEYNNMVQIVEPVLLDPPNAPQIGDDENTPNSGDEDVPIEGTVLSWTCDDPDGDDLTYDVYFGVNYPPALLVDSQDSTRYELPLLEELTTYYWRIVAFDTQGDSTAGSVWFFTTSTAVEVRVYYGNPDGGPIETELGERFDLPVFIHTEPHAYGGSILLALGVNGQYIDSLLSATEGEIMYPFTDWDAAYFNTIAEYEPGWFTESFQGFYELYPPYTSPALHFDVPTQILTLKMKTTTNPDYDDYYADAFDYGNDPFQGYSNMSDTTGSIVYNLQEIFNLLQIGEPVGIENETQLPSDYFLGQNYPNPFNAVTSIEFTLPKASQTSVKIYDIRGRLVEQINNGVMSAGHHRITWNAADIPSGMYFYKLIADDFSDTRKMMLLK